MNFFKIKKNDIREQDDNSVIKDNYIEVNDNFKMSDLKPYQRLIILKDGTLDKRFLVDFALTRDEIDRLNNIHLDSRSEELKTEKPFRMISSYDIELGQGKISEEKISSSTDELSILDNLAKENPFRKTILKNSGSGNSNNLNILKMVEEEERNTKSFKSRKNNDELTINENDNESDDEIEQRDNIENFNSARIDDDDDVALKDFSVNDDEDAINSKLKEKYKDKLIFDDDGTIEIYDNDVRTVILPFKLREVNEEWKKNDPTFFRTSLNKSSNKWFANHVDDEFLKSLEESYNGSLASPFLETYEPVNGIDMNPENVMDQNSISSDDSAIFVLNKNNIYDTSVIEEENQQELNQEVESSDIDLDLDELNQEVKSSEEVESSEIDSNVNDLNQEVESSEIDSNVNDLNQEVEFDNNNLTSEDDLNDTSDNLDENQSILIDNNLNSSDQTHSLNFENVENKKEGSIFNDQIEVSFVNEMLTVNNEHNWNPDDEASMNALKEYEDTLFFKKDIVLEKNNINNSDENNGLVHDKKMKKMHNELQKENSNTKYEKIKLSKLNNMVIFRKKIDKKLIKERNKKPLFNQMQIN
ncbi:MAG: hypothetical protein RSE95_02065 [Malacoplasma sp.]